jgi:hypothetical protein
LLSLCTLSLAESLAFIKAITQSEKRWVAASTTAATRSHYDVL